MRGRVRVTSSAVGRVRGWIDRDRAASGELLRRRAAAMADALYMLDLMSEAEWRATRVRA